MDSEAYILLGSNIGDRKRQLLEARNLIESRVGKIIKASSVYETEPWGHENQEGFLNQALLVYTSLTPFDLLTIVKQIETDLGREKRDKWKQREIDIDILFYDSLILQEHKLKIPHSHLHERMFTLIPLLEIAPDKVHPLWNLTVEDLYTQCKDLSEVYFFEEE